MTILFLPCAFWTAQGRRVVVAPPRWRPCTAALGAHGPMTSQMTCSAGSLRRRIKPLPVACSAWAIQRGYEFAQGLQAHWHALKRMDELFLKLHGNVKRDVLNTSLLYRFVFSPVA